MSASVKVVPLDEAEPRIKLVPFDKITLGSEARYLVQDIIPRTGLVVIWGPPKTFKSFWTYDLAMHIALGWKYRGRHVEQGPVVYAAFEGQSGVRARVEAFRQKFLAEQCDPIPFFLEPLQLDLVKDADELIAAIRAAMDTPPAAIVLDTLNRSLRGSESSDQDMTAYVRASDKLREAFDCAVLIVHHCGIDGTRPRGHTALGGAVDAQLAVKRDGADRETVTVEWMKDGKEGECVTSQMEVVELGIDEAGESITSCVVVAAEPSAIDTARGPRLTPNQNSMLNILDDAMPKGLTLDEWNDLTRETGIGVRRRATLMDIRKALKDKRLIHTYADRWYITHSN